jgi:hypothetical protein
MASNSTSVNARWVPAHPAVPHLGTAVVSESTGCIYGAFKPNYATVSLVRQIVRKLMFTTNPG